jgi:hypothetical protein
LLPALKGPQRCSRHDGLHIFKNGALTSAKHSFWGGSKTVLQPKRCSYLDGMHTSHVHDLCVLCHTRHPEPPESNMSTPLKDVDHFRTSQSLIPSRMLRFRTFWSLLGPAGAFWSLLEALLGLPVASRCLLEPPGALQHGLNTKENT